MSRVESLLQTVNIYRERAKTSLIDCKERFVDIIRRPQNHKEELVICLSRVAITASLILGVEGYLNHDFVHKFIAGAAMAISLPISAVFEQKYNR